MRTENYYDQRYVATMSFNEFKLLAAAIMDGHVDMDYRNPEIGLRVTNFDGWQNFVENDPMEPVSIECRFRHLAPTMKVVNGKVHHFDTNKMDVRRRKFLESFGFRAY